MCIPSPKPQPLPAPAASVVPSLAAATNPVLGDPTLGSRGGTLLGRLALRLGGGQTTSGDIGGGGTQGNDPGTSTPGTGGPAPMPAVNLIGGGLGLGALRLGNRGAVV